MYHTRCCFAGGGFKIFMPIKVLPSCKRYCKRLHLETKPTPCATLPLHRQGECMFACCVVVHDVSATHSTFRILKAKPKSASKRVDTDIDNQKPRFTHHIITFVAYTACTVSHHTHDVSHSFSFTYTHLYFFSFSLSLSLSFSHTNPHAV